MARVGSLDAQEPNRCDTHVTVCLLLDHKITCQLITGLQPPCLDRMGTDADELQDWGHYAALGSLEAVSIARGCWKRKEKCQAFPNRAVERKSRLEE